MFTSFLRCSLRQVLKSKPILKTKKIVLVNNFKSFDYVVKMPKRKVNNAVAAAPTEDEPVKAKRGRGKKEVEPVEENLEDVVATPAEPVTAPKRKLRGKNDVGDTEAQTSENPPEKPKAKKEKKPKAEAKKAEIEDEKEEVEKPTKGRKKAAPKETKSEEKAAKPEKAAKSTTKKEKKVEETTEAKPKRGRKQKTEEPEEEGEETSPVPEKAAKPKKATKAKSAPKEAKTTAEPANQTETNWKDVNFSCAKKNAKGDDYNLKIVSWNVDGVRAWIKKGGLEIFKYADPDIFCLQETKCSEDKMPEELNIEGYHRYTCASDKDGYAGVALYSKIEPIDVQYGIGEDEHDDEGRCITAEYDKFFMVCVYVPNSGRGLVTLPKRLKWNESFKEFIKSLDNQKPVIIAGDMNVAHSEIDLTNPTTNTKNAGFTKEEREGMTDFLEDGYVDTFRHFYPDKTGVYTFWSYMNKARSKNIGWRLDYFTVSERILDNVCDNVVQSNVFGSDHCPLTLFITL